MFFERHWDEIIPEEQHRHEEGEDRRGCANCNIPELIPENSQAWRIYHEITGEFIRDYGLANWFIEKLEMRKEEKLILLKKLNLIHRTYLNIERQKIERERREEVLRRK